MYRYLCQHPNVVEPLGKELHYFSYNYTKGIHWYQSHFPKPSGAADQTFEATPYYLFHPTAPTRVHALLPDVRLIVLLRNPVDRAFSHYQHSWALGAESLTFEEALAAEAARLDGEVARIVDDPAYPGLAHRQFSYFGRGCYADQLEEWLRYFPRSQMFIARSEDFYRDTATVYRQALEFVGLEDFRLASYPRHTGATPWLGPPLAATTRQQLDERYASSNIRLAELLGCDFAWND